MKRWAEMSPRARDALVAQKVMGWTRVSYYPQDDTAPHADCVNGLRPDGNFTAVPCYTTDISAAWDVVKAIGQMEKETRYNFDDLTCNFYHLWELTPETICLAAVKAVGVNVE